MKRNWKGCTKCCFCSREETIQHLFFDCHMSRFIWNSLFLSFGITPPSSVANLYGSWYKSFPLKYRKTAMILEHLLFVGPYGFVEMMRFSKIRSLTPFCRSFSEGLTGLGAGLCYVKRKRGSS